MYREQVEEDARRVNNIVSRKMILNAAGTFDNDFSREAKRVNADNRVDYCNYISQDKDGLFYLDESSAAQLRDDTRAYITDPGEIQLYELHNKIISELNELFSGKKPPLWSCLFPIENEKFIYPERDIVNYKLLVEDKEHSV